MAKTDLPHAAPPFVIEIVVALAAIGPAARLAGRLARREVAEMRTPPALALTALLGIVFLWAAAARAPPLVFALSLALGWTLACLAVVDVAVFRLPDILTLPLLVGGVGVAAFLPGAPVADHLVGAAVGWAALEGPAWAYRRWRGVEGVGGGDAKLLGAAGAWLGWSPLPSVLLIACLAAFAGLAARRLLGGTTGWRDRLAFGPPLCLGFWIVWLHGPLIR